MSAPPPDPPRFVSAQQVADRAGVSRSAVSRAFTPGASIAPETREKIMSVAAELGYQVNDLARGLLANRSRLVGLVVTRPELGFRAHLVAALTRALIRRGNVPIIIDTGRSEQELGAARTALFGHRAEATIVLSGSPPASFVELARRNGQPLVMIGRSEPDCDHVRVDNDSAARQAAVVLAGRGARLLGLIGSDSATPMIVERERAFLDEARRRGVAVEHVRAGDTDYGGGAAAAPRLFAGPVRPDGVFCVNDLLAIGLVDALRADGRARVPDDVAVIGFDDIPEAAWGAYEISSFRQDPDEIAAAALAHLDRRLLDPGAAPATTRLAAPFVERRSTAAPPAR